MTENQQGGNSYQNPQYQPRNTYTQPLSIESNGMGTAGFVISLLAILLGWIPFIGWVLGIFLWLLGFIFSFIGAFKKPRGLAIAGLVISLISLLGLIVLIFLFGILAIAAITSN